MYNYTKSLKNHKSKKFKLIKSSFKYLFFCRHFDLKSKDVLILKNILNKKNINFNIIKQNIFKKEYDINSQGPVLVFYFNEFEKIEFLNKFLKNSIKIEPICICYDDSIVSILKLNKILKNQIPLPYQLTKPLLNIYKIFLNIQK